MIIITILITQTSQIHSFVIYLVPVIKFFFETKREVEIYKKNYSKNVTWFPNSRKKSNLEKTYKNCKLDDPLKIIFVGKICEEKGAFLLINVAAQLNEVITVDFFGSCQDKNLLSIMDKVSNVNFKGTIDPCFVPDKLVNYDLLCLPTKYNGEGYPGVILEAFSVGLPVISTKWQAIPEIVDHDENGWLIEVDDFSMLTYLLINLKKDKALLERVSKKAKESFSVFDENLLDSIFLKKSKEIS